MEDSSDSRSQVSEVVDVEVDDFVLPTRMESLNPLLREIKKEPNAVDSENTPWTTRHPPALKRVRNTALNAVREGKSSDEEILNQSKRSRLENSVSRRVTVIPPIDQDILKRKPILVVGNLEEAKEYAKSQLRKPCILSCFKEAPLQEQLCKADGFVFCNFKGHQLTRERFHELFNLNCKVLSAVSHKKHLIRTGIPRFFVGESEESAMGIFVASTRYDAYQLVEELKSMCHVVNLFNGSHRSEITEVREDSPDRTVEEEPRTPALSSNREGMPNVSKSRNSSGRLKITTTVEDQTGTVLDQVSS